MWIRGRRTLLILLMILVSAAAGCVTLQTEPEPKPIEFIAMPEEMQNNLTIFLNAEQRITQGMMANIEDLRSIVLSDDANDQKIRAWLQEYYTRLGVIHSTLYSDAATGKQISVMLDTRDYATFPFPEYQESDFAAREHIFAGPTYVEGDTFLITLAVPFYDADGTYRGYWMQAYDPYVAVKYLYILSGADSSYIVYLVRPDGTVLYSTRSYTIGNSIDATYPGFELEKILFSNTSVGMHYTIPSADYFGYTQQILT